MKLDPVLIDLDLYQHSEERVGVVWAFLVADPSKTPEEMNYQTADAVAGLDCVFTKPMGGTDAYVRCEFHHDAVTHAGGITSKSENLRLLDQIPARKMKRLCALLAAADLNGDLGRTIN